MEFYIAPTFSKLSFDRSKSNKLHQQNKIMWHTLKIRQQIYPDYRRREAIGAGGILTWCDI